MLMYEEESLKELQKQTFSNSYCTQLNKKISEFAVEIQQHVIRLIFVNIIFIYSRIVLQCI